MLAKRIPEIISLGAPASTDEIGGLESRLGLRLPDEYRQLLGEANGLEANLIQIYPCEDVLERNETYEVNVFAPDFILIGCVNSFPVLLKSGSESAVFENDWGAMTEDCMVKLAANLNEWIARGCPDKTVTRS